MKISTEFYNGIIIFFAIGVYFLLMNALGFSDIFYLRLLNVLFVFYGVNRTIQMNLAEGKKNFVSNAVSAMMTSLIGIALSILGLIIFSYIQGGDNYVQSLSETFLFGGNPSVMAYSISLLFEGIASSVIVTMLIMLYWNNQFKAD
jgi:multisubunit Na+/H+ antiporter MnhC subunit